MLLSIPLRLPFKNLSSFSWTRLRAWVMSDERSMIISGLALMALLGLFMGLISILVLNTKATKGYLLNSLEADRQSLTVDKEVTETLILQAQSLTTIETAAVGMTHPTEDVVSFVLPLDEVAKAR